LNWRVKKKRYNHFKRCFLRHREWQYEMVMTNILMSNDIIPKRRNIRRAVEYAWRHRTI
jgi:zona occludens toxin (predicted ATPase)